MLQFLSNGVQGFIALMKTFQITDAIDIFVISFLIYNIIKLIRETRAEQLIKGLIILAAAYFLSYQLSLKMVSKLFTNFLQIGLIAVLVVFQPELRRALERIGTSSITKYMAIPTSSTNYDDMEMAQRKCINAVVNAASEFNKSKTGALIVFERETKLGEIISTGTIISAAPTPPIIGNIFFNKAPLHDGAMIMKNGVIYAAGCILPLTKNNNISIDLGTRHRAALGVSEISDAVVVVVSEETGTISLVVNGQITRNYTKETLQNTLEDYLIPKKEETNEKKIPFISIIRRNKNEKDK